MATIMFRCRIQRRILTVISLVCVCWAAGLTVAHGQPMPVDVVVVYKGKRIIQLLRGDDVIRSYPIALGKNSLGHKERAGDCRTPEGQYILDYRNASSRFYKSIHISYPNSHDVSEADKRGVHPGANIMIHGLPKGFEDLGDCHFTRNWTKGCIAVNNAQIDEIWRLVADGTPIVINP